MIVSCVHYLYSIPRRRLIISGVAAFGFSLLLYLYMVGAMIAAAATQQELSRAREAHKLQFAAAEKEIIHIAQDLKLSFFLARGYEESAALDVIMPKSNVARISQKSSFE